MQTLPEGDLRGNVAESGRAADFLLDELDGGARQTLLGQGLRVVALGLRGPGAAFLGLELGLAFEGLLRLGVGGLGCGAGRRTLFHREADSLPRRQGEQQQGASPDQPRPEASPAQLRLVAVVMFGQGRGGHLEHVRHHHQELLLQMAREAVDRDVLLDLVHAGGGKRRAVVFLVRPAFLSVMGPEVDEVQRKLRFGQDLAGLVGPVQVGTREASVLGLPRGVRRARDD